MRETSGQMGASPIEEDLRLIFQPAKRARMNDPGPIALKFGPIGVTLLGIFAAARFACFLGKGREPSALGRFHLFARSPTFAHGAIILQRSTPGSFFSSLRAEPVGFGALQVLLTASRRPPAKAPLMSPNRRRS